MRGLTDSVIIMSLIMAAFVGFCVGMLFQEWRDKRLNREPAEETRQQDDASIERAGPVRNGPIILMPAGGVVVVNGKTIPVCNPPYGQNLN